MKPPSYLWRRVFVDTSAYVALIDAADGNHTQAARILNRLTRERWPLFTNNLIVAETHGLPLARRGRYLASRGLAEIDAIVSTTFVRVAARDELELRARQILAAYDDHDFSPTDATSFAVMERLRIAHAFTFDRHFSEVGFQVLEAASELREEPLAYVS